MLTIADTPEAVRTRHGLTLLPDAAAGTVVVARMQSPDADPPGAALDRRLRVLRGSPGRVHTAPQQYSVTSSWRGRVKSSAARIASST